MDDIRITGWLHQLCMNRDILRTRKVSRKLRPFQRMVFRKIVVYSRLYSIPDLTKCVYV